VSRSITSKGWPMKAKTASDWLDALKTAETAGRRWERAVRALTAMGQPVVPALIQAMGDGHPEVRRGAGKALQKIGPAIIPFLIQALRHDNSLVKEKVARLLYGFAPKAQQAIPALCEALRYSESGPHPLTFFPALPPARPAGGAGSRP